MADPATLTAERAAFGLGEGELAAILLSSQLRAGLTLLDDFEARQLARARGLNIRGCVGVLEAAFRLHILPDLREAYSRLLDYRVYIDRRILEASLQSFHLPPL